MRSATPVLPGHEKMIAETIMGKGQPEYDPLPAILVPGPDSEVLTRWELTDEEKILLLSGGHVYLSLKTFGNPVQPVLLRIATPEMIIDEPREVQLPRETLKPDVSTEEEAPPS